MILRLAIILAIIPYFVVAAEKNSELQAPSIAPPLDKLSPAFLTKEEKNYIANSKPFVVCNVTQALRTGASLRLIEVLTQYTKMNLVESPLLTWQEALDGLKNKTCDILPWATETAARTATMNFTRPYARIVRVLITKQEQPYISNIGFYGDKVFAIENGNNIFLLLKKRYPNILTIRSKNTAQGFEFVATDKVFASIASLYSVGGLFVESELDLKIAGRLPPEFDDVVSLATRKEDQILHGILQRAVLTVDKSLVNQFMNEGAIYTYEPEENYKKIWTIGILGLFLLFTLVWWNRYLTRLNNKLGRAHTELKIKSELLEVLSITDPLTDTFNRIKMDSVFAQEIKRSERYQHPLSIFMIDVDYFKNVNDTYGHLVGDKVLAKFASVLKKKLRSHDILGRWGGEEFLVICPATGLKEAIVVAEKLRQMIEDTDFSPLIKMTASFGVTEWKKGDTQEILVSKADYAMYLSKHQGRNKVSFSEHQS